MFKRKKRSYISLEDEELLKLLGISVDGVSSNKLKEATYFTCMRILCDSISKLPCKLYRDTGNGKEKVSNHYLYNLLKIRPNPYMSASDFWKCVEFQRNHYGNAIVVIDVNNKTGMIEGLYPVDFKNVEIWIDDAGIIGNKNAIWYVIKGKDGLEYKFFSDEILHFKALTTDGIVGISIKDYLTVIIENAQSGQQYINNYFSNGLFAKGILHYTGDINETSERKMQERFERMVGGVSNAGKILPLPLGFSFTPLNTSMADAQFLELNELTIRQIAAAFGVKMHHLNDLNRATHTNIEEQQKSFYIDTLQSILTMYEQELTYKLLLDKEIALGYYFKFNVDSILRSDIKTRYEAYRIGIQSGFLTPNEVREKEELSPQEGGDILICNGNMQKLIDVGAYYKNKKGGENDGEKKQE
ncbi:phage portal protein [Caminicella sporogenes]|uniref:phage portal protein n=1 Tax=Caminicella sporogenes TaxID=166485 RepID=UPI00254261DC|nr:phage portal protein [Caminicella sporogenes]WIF95130.1 phage portal protein [Caminicella sporogenes]